LVGATNYVKSLNLVAGETYPDIFSQATTITISNIAGARTITYAP
jgi:type IV pilus assembly protein PilA